MKQLQQLIDTHRHISRFLIVGGISFAIDYGLLLATYHMFKLPLAVATTVGYLIGLCLNFMLNKLWTFEAPHTARQSARQAALYGVLVVINLILTNWIIVSLSAVGIHPEISKPISTGLIMVINFCAYKWVIFKKRPVPIETVEPY